MKRLHPYTSIYAAPLLLLLIICADSSHAQTYSKLWGKNGELWDKKRIPDFTNAGYKSGKATIPDCKEII